ncbi:unnamed protein product [Vitrella brassicaformis CCMP3155]|uniref:U2A'/phosphoprotein 32 family A C-terminal domain-containing protein n=1 Tax=Vitrella brassicaformis (strain CCMP3155) TaxID=1169540 RepID=A0A0G4EVJ3_VITBC|nr:unnamed protein product [Vitrella brassicaformis CCMP3155]|eukprot:CEM02656.1 unnamed protein product [Vitrella brassicaformis CCMP3155]
MRLREREDAPLDVLDPSYLRHITDADDLSSVRSVELCVDVDEQPIAELGELLPSLRHLRLNGSNVPSLRELGVRFGCLRVLWLTRCGVRDLGGVQGLPALQELYLAFNAIEELWPLAGHECLEVLDLEGNELRSLQEVTFLTSCPALRHLTLQANPLTHDPAFSPQWVAERLPQLQTLDDAPLGSRSGLLEVEEVGEESEERQQESEPDEWDEVPSGRGVPVPTYARGHEVEVLDLSQLDAIEEENEEDNGPMGGPSGGGFSSGSCNPCLSAMPPLECLVSSPRLRRMKADVERDMGREGDAAESAAAGGAVRGGGDVFPGEPAEEELLVESIKACRSAAATVSAASSSSASRASHRPTSAAALNQRTHMPSRPQSAASHHGPFPVPPPLSLRRPSTPAVPPPSLVYHHRPASDFGWVADEQHGAADSGVSDLTVGTDRSFAGSPLAAIRHSRQRSTQSARVGERGRGGGGAGGVLGIRALMAQVRLEAATTMSAEEREWMKQQQRQHSRQHRRIVTPPAPSQAPQPPSTPSDSAFVRRRVPSCRVHGAAAEESKEGGLRVNEAECHSAGSTAATRAPTSAQSSGVG